jgi:ankyrin repeat protein
MIGKIKKIGNDLLFHAISHANVHDVIALLEENEVDVNCANINGHTPLHVRMKV